VMINNKRTCGVAVREEKAGTGTSGHESELKVGVEVSMCQLHTEGTQYGCGHYVITNKYDKRDCDNRYCIYSTAHPSNCPNCPNCKRYYGPDLSETITRRTTDYCSECQWWYQGDGAKNKR